MQETGNGSAGYKPAMSDVQREATATMGAKAALWKEPLRRPSCHGLAVQRIALIFTSIVQEVSRNCQTWDCSARSLPSNAPTPAISQPAPMSANDAGSQRQSVHLST
jgi:hypothetical protein